MSTEPKYRIHASMPVGTPEDWDYDQEHDTMVSPVFDTWDAAMAKAVELGIGRKTGEAGTFELDQGVEIKAVKE